MSSILWSNATAKPDMSIPDLIEGKTSLVSYYKKELSSFPGLLRIPSEKIHQYANRAYQQYIEHIIQSLVRQARLAMEESQADCLLAGCVSCDAGFAIEQKERAQSYAEQVIYLIDNGVDCLYIQNQGDNDSLLALLQVIQKVNHVPVPIVVSLKQLPSEIDKDFIPILSFFEVHGICSALSIEQLASLSTKELTFPFQEQASGFVLEASKQNMTKEQLQLAAHVLQTGQILFSGNNIDTNTWQTLQNFVTTKEKY